MENLKWLLALTLAIPWRIYNKKGLSKKAKKIAIVVYFIILIVMGIAIMIPNSFEGLTTAVNQSSKQEGAVTSTDPGTLEVHFLDVGQALSVLVKDDKGNELLYDAGNNGDGDFIVSYLASEGVDDLEYLINSHPHEDHLGGMDTVLQNYDAEVVMMSNKTYTTKAYMDVITEVVDRNISITDPNVGDRFAFGDSTIEILGPIHTDYEETNDYSIVIMIHHGNENILLTGDAEALSESEMIEAGVDLDADLLQVGHHGSSSSSSMPFLEAVTPDYAVISSGEGNDYGHPHQEALDRLDQIGTEVLRTDTEGTIVFKITDDEISYQTYKEKSNP